MPRIDDLKYFVTVAEVGNVSRASEILGLSQPALSQALKRLEDELGQSLFDRSNSGLRLRRDGTRFLTSAREMIETWQRAVRLASSTDAIGHYRIGMHNSVALYSLPLFAKALLAKHPGLTFSIHHGLSRHVANDVIEHRYDLGVVINPPAHPDLVIKRLGVDEVALYRTKAAIDESTLLVQSDLMQSQEILKQLKKLKRPFQRQIEASSLEVVATMAVEGCGVAVLPGRVAAHYSQLRRLDQSPIVKDLISLIYRPTLKTDVGGAAIIDAISSAKF